MFIFWSFSAPPLITSPTNDTWEIMAGKSVTIECLAESDPSSSYVWKNTAGAVVADGRQLRLHKVNDSSGGNYICTATNKLGSDDRSIIVLVRSKLFFSFYISSTYWQRACLSRKPQKKKDKNTSDENHLLLICAGWSKRFNKNFALNIFLHSEHSNQKDEVKPTLKTWLQIKIMPEDHSSQLEFVQNSGIGNALRLCLGF